MSRTIAMHESSIEEIEWQWVPFEALSTHQLYAVLKLRQEVFLLEQRCFYPDADGLDERCWHGLGRARDGRLVACARIVPPDASVAEPAIGRVVVAPDWRAIGLGSLLMQQSIAVARQCHPGKAIRIAAQANLERFYEQLGFLRDGEVYDDAGILHCDMSLRAEPNRLRQVDAMSRACGAGAC